MENLLTNPGRTEDRFYITTLLFPEDKWTKQASEKWVKRRYRNYEYLGKIANYYQYRVLPKKQIEELEKKSAELRGGEVGYRVFTFPSEKHIRALMLVVAPPVSDIGESPDGEVIEGILENPVRKVTPEIEKEIKRLWKEGYKVIQIRGIIKDKFGVSISAPTVRNIIKGIKSEKAFENLEGGEDMGALPSELVKKALSLLKEGKFRDKSEAFKWAHKVNKEGISERTKAGNYERVASEILINKGGRTMAKRKKEAMPANLQRTLARLTKAVESLSNPAKKRKRAKKRPPEGTLASALSEAMRKVWATDPVLRSIRERLATEYSPLIRRTWEERPEMREEIKDWLRLAWMTEPGRKLRESLSEEVKRARMAKSAETPISMLGEPELEPELDLIEALATEVLFEEIGLPEQFKPFTKEMGIEPVLKEAWETPAGKKMKEILRMAWMTEPGRELREELSRRIKEARLRIYPTGGLGDIADTALTDIAQAVGGWKPFRPGMAPYLRRAWSIPEAEKLKEVLSTAIALAWGSPTGAKFKRALREKLSGFWYGKPPREVPITELSAIEQFPGDIMKALGVDYLIPGAISTVAESWVHFLLKQLTAIPFGKLEDIEKVYWKKALHNLLTGGIHYALINYLINQFGRGMPFIQKAKVMYSAYIIRDVMTALLPKEIFPGGVVRPKPTGELEGNEVESVEYGVLPLDELKVSETGELEVPIEVYERIKATSRTFTVPEEEYKVEIETTPEEEETDEFEYIEEIYPTPEEEEIVPEVTLEQTTPEIEPEVTLEEEKTEEIES